MPRSVFISAHLSLQPSFSQRLAIRPYNTTKAVAGLHSVLERAGCLALPVDDLFRDVLYDGLQEAGTPGPRNAGFAKGVRDQCAMLGFVRSAC